MKIKLALLACTSLLVLHPAWAETYVSDPNHTQATFETGHSGISWLRGRFNKVEAKIVLDRAAKTGSIDATVAMASLDTGHEARDKHVRSEDYLAVDKYPTMTFKSTSLKFDGDHPVSADGDLTLMGRTKPVTLAISLFKCVGPPVTRRETCGAEAQTQIKRSEFGIGRPSTGINDDVVIRINIEAFKQ